ncbi:MAG: hypothetical protein GWO24_24645, partial [Akkermansiaceae bacterium]|nr:hypothetical protein [Akkermansiaceae bacterium]
MALAILLVCVLVFVAWRGREVPWRRRIRGPGGKVLWWLALGVFALTVVEGVMGSQVRELTDEFARTFGSETRAEWTAKLEHSAIYLVHRSFSWLIVLGTAGFVVLGRKQLED